MTEQDIISGCKEYNERAFKALVENYSALLMGICMRYMGDIKSAEDNLQESFILIFKNILNYEDKGSLKAWLCKITVNTCLKSLRKKVVFFDLDDIANTLSDVSLPIDNLDETEVFRAVQKLPDKYRIVFNLYVVEGFSHKEIADLIKIKESTSRSVLTRAKEKLQNYLNNNTFQIKIDNY